MREQYHQYTDFPKDTSILAVNFLLLKSEKYNNLNSRKELTINQMTRKNFKKIFFQVKQN